MADTFLSDYTPVSNLQDDDLIPLSDASDIDAVSLRPSTKNITAALLASYISSKGVGKLFPVGDLASRDAIENPAEGQEVYVISNQKSYRYISGNWTEIVEGQGATPFNYDDFQQALSIFDANNDGGVDLVELVGTTTNGDQRSLAVGDLPIPDSLDELTTNLPDYNPNTDGSIADLMLVGKDANGALKKLQVSDIPTGNFDFQTFLQSLTQYNNSVDGAEVDFTLVGETANGDLRSIDVSQIPTATISNLALTDTNLVYQNKYINNAKSRSVLEELSQKLNAEDLGMHKLTGYNPSKVNVDQNITDTFVANQGFLDLNGNPITTIVGLAQHNTAVWNDVRNRIKNVNGQTIPIKQFAEVYFGEGLWFIDAEVPLIRRNLIAMRGAGINRTYLATYKTENPASPLIKIEDDTAAPVQASHFTDFTINAHVEQETTGIYTGRLRPNKQIIFGEEAQFITSSATGLWQSNLHNVYIAHCWTCAILSGSKQGAQNPGQFNNWLNVFFEKCAGRDEIGTGDNIIVKDQWNQWVTQNLVLQKSGGNFDQLGRCFVYDTDDDADERLPFGHIHICCSIQGSEVLFDGYASENVMFMLPYCEKYKKAFRLTGRTVTRPTAGFTIINGRFTDGQGVKHNAKAILQQASTLSGATSQSITAISQGVTTSITVANATDIAIGDYLFLTDFVPATGTQDAYGLSNLTVKVSGKTGNVLDIQFANDTDIDSSAFPTASGGIVRKQFILECYAAHDYRRPSEYVEPVMFTGMNGATELNYVKDQNEKIYFAGAIDNAPNLLRIVDQSEGQVNGITPIVATDHTITGIERAQTTITYVYLQGQSLALPAEGDPIHISGVVGYDSVNNATWTYRNATEINDGGAQDGNTRITLYNEKNNINLDTSRQAETYVSGGTLSWGGTLNTGYNIFVGNHTDVTDIAGRLAGAPDMDVVRYGNGQYTPVGKSVSIGFPNSAGSELRFGNIGTFGISGTSGVDALVQASTKIFKVTGNKTLTSLQAPVSVGDMAIMMPDDRDGSGLNINFTQEFVWFGDATVEAGTYNIPARGAVACLRVDHIPNKKWMIAPLQGEFEPDLDVVFTNESIAVANLDTEKNNILRNSSRSFQLVLPSYQAAINAGIVEGDIITIDGQQLYSVRAVATDDTGNNNGKSVLLNNDAAIGSCKIKLVLKERNEASEIDYWQIIIDDSENSCQHFNIVGHGLKEKDIVYFNKTTMLWTRADASDPSKVGSAVIARGLGNDNYIVCTAGESIYYLGAYLFDGNHHQDGDATGHAVINNGDTLYLSAADAGGAVKTKPTLTDGVVFPVAKKISNNHFQYFFLAPKDLVTMYSYRQATVTDETVNFTASSTDYIAFVEAEVDTGDVDLEVQIDGTPVTGLENTDMDVNGAASPKPQVFSATTPTAINYRQTLSLIKSNNNAATGLRVTIYGFRIV